MKTSLWEIERDFRNIIAELEDNGGELTDQITEAIAINKNDFEQKAQSYYVVLANYNNEIEKASFEIKRLAEKNKKRELIISQLNERLKSAVHLYGTSKLTKTGRKNYVMEFPNLDVSLVSNASEIVELDEGFTNAKYSKYNIKDNFNVEDAKKLIKFIKEELNTTPILEAIIQKSIIKEDLNKGLEIENARLKINYNINFK